VTGGLTAAAVGQPVPHTIAFAAVSAVAALLPDADEENSYVGRRLPAIVGVYLAGSAVYAASKFALPMPKALLPYPFMEYVLYGLAAFFVGLLVGGGFPAFIRAFGGGHRHLLHSLLFASAVALLGLGAFAMGLKVTSIGLFLFAWGVILHDIADVVTPSGVPLLWPLSSYRVRIFPRAVCAFGETIINAIAVLAGIAGTWWFFLR
jgi:membrane-bound metal-dependent hydrolase YbcI (DUF457 family)